MNKDKSLSARLSDIFGPRFVSLIVLFHGVFIVVISLADQLIYRRHLRLNNLSLDITLGIGLTLIYLSALLGRRKRTALIVASVAYAFYLGANIEGLTDVLQSRHHSHLLWFVILRSIILPLAILLLLFVNRNKFVVRSDAQGFRTALTLSAIILAVTFVYGTIGFYRLGPTGFHQRLSVPAAMHYTVDQLNVTTDQPIHAYSGRAKLFDDSLTFISISAVLYVLVAFVQPLRARFSDQKPARERFKLLIESQGDAVSEDFFKLWPHDKQYFFDSNGLSGLAFHVRNGVALVLDGPAGKRSSFGQLLREFQYVCWGNDWRLAVIHADDSLRSTYEGHGLSMQKIGEEAVVDLEQFTTTTVKDKYFRNIVNRFDKQGYSFELLSPPHHQAVQARLREISKEWLGMGNHAERGYAMGYFSGQYMSMCAVAVARDAAGTIQAFVNLVPAEFDKEEATYDLMRASPKALGNVNDYLLINLCQTLQAAGYKRINLGFTPLVGMDSDDNKGLISGVLEFAYANGDRFYSFSGLYRFKNKYAPEWKPRYIVYQGGIRGFTRAMNALVRTMSVTAKHHHKLHKPKLRSD